MSGPILTKMQIDILHDVVVGVTSKRGVWTAYYTPGEGNDKLYHYGYDKLIELGYLLPPVFDPETKLSAFYVTQAGINLGMVIQRNRGTPLSLRDCWTAVPPVVGDPPPNYKPTDSWPLGITSYHEFVNSMWTTHPGEIHNASMSDAIRRHNRSLTIASLGLAGETGEVVEHIKKHFRDGVLDKDAVTKELGDLIFYWFRLHTELGLEPLATLAANMAKLKARRAAGTIQGKGNER